MSNYTPPSQEDLLQLAIAVAKVAHSGQRRRGSGEPYFNHAQRVAESVLEGKSGVRAATIAYLHDTIEDTPIMRATLTEIGFPRDIVHDVVLLTRGTDERYSHYIARLTEYGSDDVLAVKLADLFDNLRDLDTLDEDTDSRRRRYLDAQEQIMVEQDRRDAAREFARIHAEKGALVA